MGIFCYQMSYKNSRPVLVDVLLTGDDSKSHFKLTKDLPAKSTCQSKLMRLINDKYPDTEWIGFRKEFHNPGQVGLVAKIPTRLGTVLAWRNGWNAGDYNYLIHAAGKTYNRNDLTEVMSLIHILLIPKEELPLHLHTELCEKNQSVLMERLKT